MVGVHPQLAARPLDDRRRLAVVVGVRVRADEEPHVVQAQVDLVERALQVRERARLVHPRVHQHHAVAGGQRPGVAVGHAGPGQGQAQAPDARQDPVAAPQLAPAGGLGHGRGR